MINCAPSIAAAAGLAVLYMPFGASAHHSFAAEFDRNLPITVTGTVTKVEWLNPHARFYVEAEDESGNKVEWDFELTSPNVLMRRGWSRNSLQIGEVVVVTGYRAKNHPSVGNASNVKLANGKQLFSGAAVGE
jgi:hypothetical protein